MIYSKKTPVLLFASMCGFFTLASAQTPGKVSPSLITTASGQLEGVISDDGNVRAFKGIPFAAPPVGSLRWKAPQPAVPWTGIRKASEFGARCMQTRVFSDMIFYDNGPSEDCLYLNVWTPAAPSQTRLPVMVWIYGGGFVAGSSSEPRQDGGILSKKGVVVVSFNYRLGIFGFFSHPELTRESGHNASGNYGLLDQVASLQWVKKNIASFGGDPDNVTIFGESAGSFSVSALMASPLAQGLFNRAIGESGAFFGSTLGLRPLAATEKAGAEFAKSLTGSDSIDALRARSAEEILQAGTKGGAFRFTANVDGYFLPQDVSSIFAAGRQSRVPLLAGWNLDEGGYRSIFGKDAPNAQNFAVKLRAMFGERADAFLKVYQADSDAQAKRSAQDLAGDQFIAYSTWKWLEMQRRTGGSPLYRYEFDQTMPLSSESAQNPATEPTAPHASEIEFVFGMLSSKKLPWRPEDQKVSDLMQSYWSNFAKTGNPNGPGLPKWPEYRDRDGYQVLHIGSEPRSAHDQHRARYELLDSLPRK